MYCQKCGGQLQGGVCPSCGTPKPAHASAGLKNGILAIVLILLLGVLVVSLVTCGGCVAAFAN